MACYHPLVGYYSRDVNDSGKRSLVFNPDSSLLPVPVQVPCGRCIGCRLDRSLSWAVRCMHEASLYDENCFITLTFNDDYISDGSLHVEDFQNFMKRLRQEIAPRRIRFFHCGEYGAKYSRPHHHACIFGYDFPDKVLFRGDIYTSEILSRLWPYGFSTVGKVTFESAAYVARYVLKKWSKADLKGEGLYEAMRNFSECERSGSAYQGRKPEYVTMSRRPGIGSTWFSKFGNEVTSTGYVLMPNGKKAKPPKFYDSRFELDDIFNFHIIKGQRYFRALQSLDNTPARLNVREEIKLIKSKQLIRRFEDEETSLLG